MISNLLATLLRLHDESVLREQIRTDLIDWATEVMVSSGLRPSAHHRHLLNNLALVSDGSLKRLLVLMPPGSAKSTYASILFPIWWFIQHPRSSIIAVSHTARLVEYFSRCIHALIREQSHRIGFGLRIRDRSASQWLTSTGGEYFGVGTQGAISGRRADLAVIDDPIRSLADADSPRFRQRLWDWYRSELTARLKPDARIVIVMTRWHEQDLAGQLMAHNPDEWHILRLPALAEDADPIGRPPGSPLWPEWEGLDALKYKQRTVGSRAWSALFQQTPNPSAGKLFKIGRLALPGDEEPNETHPIRVVRAWDLAATVRDAENDPDWTVGLKLTLEKNGRFVIEDIVRMRGNYLAVQEAVVSTAHSDGRSVIVSLPIDPGQAGKSQAAQLSSLLAGHRVYTSLERGSKLSRATLVAAQIEAGNFVVRPGPWRRAFIDELTSFPQSIKDDQVDALSRAFITFSDIPSAGRRLFVPYHDR